MSLGFALPFGLFNSLELLLRLIFSLSLSLSIASFFPGEAREKARANASLSVFFAQERGEKKMTGKGKRKMRREESWSEAQQSVSSWKPIAELYRIGYCGGRPEEVLEKCALD